MLTIRVKDLKLGDHVIVYDIGKNLFSDGMTVVGTVVVLEYDEITGYAAEIKGVNNIYYDIDDMNKFEKYKLRKSNDIQQRKRRDMVNHPSHYNFGDIEVIDFIEQVTKHYNAHVAYHVGNAIKYISRAPHKNGKEDIDKAKWYLERAFEKWEAKDELPQK